MKDWVTLSEKGVHPTEVLAEGVKKVVKEGHYSYLLRPYTHTIATVINMLCCWFFATSHCYLIWKTLVEANILSLDGSMTKVTASCYDLADEGTPCVLWLEDIHFSNGWKRSEDAEGQKNVCCAGYLPFVPPDPLFTPPHPTLCSLRQFCSDYIRNPSCLLVSDGSGQWGNQGGDRGMEEGGESGEVMYFLAFFRQVCFRLAVTLDQTSLCLSRSWLLSSWSLNHKTPFWVSSDCSLPSSFSLGMVTTTLLQAPGYWATHHIFLHPAHDFVHSPFAKPALNYPSSVCLLFCVATLTYNTPSLINYSKLGVLKYQNFALIHS